MILLDLCMQWRGPKGPPWDVQDGQGEGGMDWSKQGVSAHVRNCQTIQ